MKNKLEPYQIPINNKTNNIIFPGLPIHLIPNGNGATIIKSSYVPLNLNDKFSFSKPSEYEDVSLEEFVQDEKDFYRRQFQNDGSLKGYHITDVISDLDYMVNRYEGWFNFTMGGGNNSLFVCFEHPIIDKDEVSEFENIIEDLSAATKIGIYGIYFDSRKTFLPYKIQRHNDGYMHDFFDIFYGHAIRDKPKRLNPFPKIDRTKSIEQRAKEISIRFKPK